MSASTSVAGSYEFTGPAEVVFGVLTDPDRVHRWLPRSLPPESVSTEQIKIRTRAYDLSIVTEHLEVRWRSADEATHGSARVQDAAAGGSVVRVEVTVPAAAGDQSAVTAMVEETMGNLQRDVSDNFNAG